jgi:tetratricopeptide (TPR) repeat protein
MEGTMAQFGGGFEDPDLQRAQDLMYQVWEESNPARRIILAHEALEICPDCADAYVLLAEEEADTLGRALEYYQNGVEAGERALGKEYFEEEKAGGFWLLSETRPYMRARRGLANVLWELDRNEEAMIQYQDMLRLNPGDNQGIRYSLLNLLLDMGRDAEARRLLKEYEGEWTAEWLYTRALLAFRSGGASQGAESGLREALGMNTHMPIYLTGLKRVPSRLPSRMGLGEDSEAAIYASSYLGHWRRTPGAVEWLQQASGLEGGRRRPKSSRSTRTKSSKSKKAE